MIACDSLLNDGDPHFKLPLEVTENKQVHICQNSGVFCNSLCDIE